MSGARIDRRSILLWFGLLGAPLAWGVQLWAGVAVAFAACQPGGAGASLPLHGIQAAVAVVAALVALGAVAASIVVVRATAHADGPRERRMHFMATMGTAIGPLLLCIIVLSGLGVSLLERCQQG